jgi:RNA recognition motif-containing protein
LLAEVGRVIDVHLPMDRESGRPRGFAFVEFSQPSEAAEAITRFHNREVGGRRLNVNAADDRPRRAGPGMPFRPSPVPSHATRSAAPPGDVSSQQDDFGGLGGRPFKNKGSRRNLRARKRSLNF